MAKKEMLAMLLAGGQGSRLRNLTEKVAKPAVPFGGRYRIIDFTLSNCTNSGIDTVGVLTQYRPFELNAHIGTGAAWDLDRTYGGVYTLPPYMDENKGNWYEGTAHAIYQNYAFIEKFDPEYILVLSGDHIYKMNYQKMLTFHKKQEADCTIAVIEVPWKDASRFGILNTDEAYRIEEFEEKPENPRSNLASMGIYIFNWKALKKAYKDMLDAGKSIEDFGQNIIPEFLQTRKKLYAYPFKGYWKDVGTVESYWEANLEIIDPHHPLDLSDRSWIVYSETLTYPPQYTGPNGKMKNSLGIDGCQVYGRVENSVLFPGAIIEEGAIVKNSVIMGGARISKDAIVEKTVVGEGAVVAEGCVIGSNSSEEVELFVKTDEEEKQC
ncbi:MAG: glucose-1-phosphate adenylyltransferase [Culicoidibacterales bacterium]